MKILSALFALALSSQSFAEQKAIVLVHGALFTADSWAPLQAELSKRGIPNFSVDIPGRKGDGIDPKTITIQTAGEKVCKLVTSLNRDVILVGHSQGGAVINQALKFCGEKVKGLFYVAAVAPKTGEIAFAKLDEKRDTNFGKCTTANPDAGLFEINPKGPLAKSFFQEIIGKKNSEAALAGMVSEPMGIGTTPLDFPMDLYTQLPKVYLTAKNDQVLTPESQKVIYRDIPNVKVKEIKSGHSPQLTRTSEVALLIERFAKEIK